MPYSIRWKKNMVCCTFRGEVSGRELIGCHMSLYSNANFARLKLQILDLSEATDLSFTQDDIRELTVCDQVAAISNPDLKRAIVSMNQVTLKHTELNQDKTIACPWQQQSFQMLSEALAWGFAPDHPEIKTSRPI